MEAKTVRKVSRENQKRLNGIVWRLSTNPSGTAELRWLHIWDTGARQARLAGKARHSEIWLVSCACRRCGMQDYISRMLKKAVQQGRSERRGEEVRTALREAVRPCNGSWRTEKPLQYFRLRETPT